MASELIKLNTELEWLEERNKIIGGTDISAILGLNKLKTPYDVWADKTG